MSISRFWVLAWLFTFFLFDSATAQTPAEVRLAFVNLRSDHIKYNCSRAMVWLFAHREALKDQIIQELYVTDRQGRDALLHVLFNTASFVADDRFRRFVMARLPEEDKFVGKLDIALDIDSGSPGGVAAHWEAWNYIDQHYADFEPLLKNAVASSDSMFVLWYSTYLFAKHHVLKPYLDLYSDQVMGRIASNLKDDDIPFNASQAVRTFLLLGAFGLPTLQRSAQSADGQMANFSRALMDCIRYGKHEAFGYLTAQVKIGDNEPAWLEPLTAKYKEELSNNLHLPYP